MSVKDSSRAVLILLTGLPGCGKTTLARKLAAHLRVPLFAKDRIQSTLRALNLADRTTEKYQPWDDRQVLRVDAADDLDENLTRALRWVGESPD